jgi:hypothetical protein
MPCLRASLRLNLAKRVEARPQLTLCRSQAAPCRQLFVTVARTQHSPPAPASPTTRPLDKINLRAQQLAGHFSSSPPSPANKSRLHTMAYTTRKVAAANTLEHRVFIEKDGQPISAWHDIPLYANEQQTILNMVVEVPRWTNAKMEVCTPPLAPAGPVDSSALLCFFLCQATAPPSRLLADRPRRSPRRRPSTPSSRTPRRASSASFATASPTRVTSGTTVPSPRYDDAAPMSAPSTCLLTAIADMGGPQCHAP